MIIEALLYCLTPCPTWSRRAGYLRESIAIGARHARLKHRWKSHLKNSQKTVVAAAEAIPEPLAREGAVLVAGSGHGFDLPLEPLAQRFNKVVLVDCVHPLSMRFRAARLHNVSLVHADVTGREGPAFDAERFELAISLNLISQLGVAATGRGDPALMRQHIDWLSKVSGQAWIIGDAERYENDALVGSAPLSLANNRIEDEWRWDLAPQGEIAPNLAVWTRVCAWRL